MPNLGIILDLDVILTNTKINKAILRLLEVGEKSVTGADYVNHPSNTLNIDI